MSILSNSNRKNNNIGSILGLNKLRNSAKRMGNTIESGFKTEKNTVTS